MKHKSVFALAAVAASIPLCGAEYRVSGPHTHENLSIFLIHGSSNPAPSFLTLQEALEQKKVIVYETRRVNELAIENVSNEDVYVQSGDIVKGGQQDRTFKDDLILPSKSGKVAITAFCVEHGRWSRRGQETVTRFDSADQAVATREMKKAVRLSANQSDVWSEVSAAQNKLKASVAGSVAAPASPTSYMLSLESPRLRKPVEDYIKSLSGIANQRDVVGYAFAVNGKLSSADIYSSHELFEKLWPKLLRASAVEAITDFRAGTQAQVPAIESVRAALRTGARAPASVSDTTARTKVVTKQTDREAIFETRDRAHSDALVHLNYLAK